MADTQVAKMEVAEPSEQFFLKLTPREVFLDEREYRISEARFKKDAFELMICFKNRSKNYHGDSITIAYKDLQALRYYVGKTPSKKSKLTAFVLILKPNFSDYQKLSSLSEQYLMLKVPEFYLVMQFSIAKDDANMVVSLLQESLGHEIEVFSRAGRTTANAHLSTSSMQASLHRALKKSQFTKKLESFFEARELCDFNICIHGRPTIPVHKVILAARSAYFETMFSHRDTVEAHRNEMLVTDVSYDVMKVLLSFLYTGEKPEDEQLSFELLAAADKYYVDELKEYCEIHLAGQLTVENVVSVFMDADLHSASKLKVFCLQFFKSNYEQVSGTSDWKRMLKSGGHRRVEVLQFIKKKLGSKQKKIRKARLFD